MLEACKGDLLRNHLAVECKQCVVAPMLSQQSVFGVTADAHARLASLCRAPALSASPGWNLVYAALHSASARCWEMVRLDDQAYAFDVSCRPMLTHQNDWLLTQPSVAVLGACLTGVGRG